MSFFASHRLRTFLLAALVFIAGSGVLWWRSATVVVSADGRTRRYAAKGPTVGDLLAKERIELGPHDFVIPSTGTVVARNMAIKITRVTHRDETRVTRTSPVVESHLRTRQNLRAIFAQRGHARETTEQVRMIFYDGRLVHEKVVSRKSVWHPFYTLTLFDKRGVVVKRYDLLKAKRLKAIATGYYVGDPLVPGDETFLGYKLQHGHVAVDPTVIPLRSRLYIPGYGYGYACDTGSRIKGNRVDLAVKDKYEERRYMHRPMTVYVLETARGW